ncbi:MAG: DNA cytosine methyltransferase [Clostridia bacterium]|nr:DNA cytosine methyltransferase [Clostridia bacterium]
MTHLNRYMPVSRLYKRKTEHLYNIKFNGNEVLKITGNHPVYVYRNNKFEFVRTDQLTINDYVCVNINQKTNKLEYSDDILWLAGRAIADGYLSKDKNKVVISVGKNKILEFEQHLSNISYYILHKDRAAPEYCINSQELTEFYAYFGNRKALDKYIPDEILNLPKQLLKKIYDGYISGDGFLRKDRPNTVMWCSSSEDLILSMGLLTAKLFGKYPTTTIREGEYKQLPSGMCHTNKSYNSQISITNRLNPDCKIIEDKLLLRIKSIDKNSINTDVYNIEVAKDHSYTVNNVIVHNCTYWSIAQSPDKRETTASGLGWDLFSQYVRALREAKPKYFIYENNKSMSKEIRKSITETFGFEPIMINSALVSAQNRQRLYWVGKRNDDGTYSKVDVEQPEDRGILLRDVLDGVAIKEKSPCIDANYYKGGNYTNVKKQSGQRMCVAEPVACRCRGRTDKNGNGYAKYECRDDCKSNTLDTNSTNGNMVAEPVNKSIRVGIYPTSDGRMLNSQGMRIYSVDGKSVTQSAQGGGMGAKTGLYAIPVTKN